MLKITALRIAGAAMVLFALAPWLGAGTASAVDAADADIFVKGSQVPTTAAAFGSHQTDCPGFDADEPFDYFHFVLDGNNHDFVELTAVFSTGPVTIKQGMFGPPSDKHAYVQAPAGATLTNAYANVTPDTDIPADFQLSHTCVGSTETSTTPPPTSPPPTTEPPTSPPPTTEPPTSPPPTTEPPTSPPPTTEPPTSPPPTTEPPTSPPPTTEPPTSPPPTTEPPTSPPPTTEPPTSPPPTTEPPTSPPPTTEPPTSPPPTTEPPTSPPPTTEPPTSPPPSGSPSESTSVLPTKVGQSSSSTPQTTVQGSNLPHTGFGLPRLLTLGLSLGLVLGGAALIALSGRPAVSTAAHRRRH